MSTRAHAQLPAGSLPETEHTHLTCLYAGPSTSVDRQDSNAESSGQAYYNFPQAQTMAAFPPAAHNASGFFDGLLSPEEQRIQRDTRAFMVRLHDQHLNCAITASEPCGDRRSSMSPLK